MNGALAHMPVLNTERLTLRPPVAEDWAAYKAYRHSPRSTLPDGLAPGEIWTHFAAFFGHWQLRGFGRFIMVETTTRRAIGHVGPYFPDDWQEPELTWTLWHKDFEGRGLAYEAALAARTHAYHHLGWKTAVSYIDGSNSRSIALANRLGAQLERTDPGKIRPFDVYRHPMLGAHA